MAENERGARNVERGTGGAVPASAADPPGPDAASVPQFRAPRSALRARVWSTLKWGLVALVVWFVARHAHRLWMEVGPEPVRIAWGPLAGAIVMSLLAWIPSVWYWQKLLRTLGQDVPWFEVIRAYYCGQ